LSFALSELVAVSMILTATRAKEREEVALTVASFGGTVQATDLIPEDEGPVTAERLAWYNFQSVSAANVRSPVAISTVGFVLALHHMQL
jgi:hypothetical protein